MLVVGAHSYGYDDRLGLPLEVWMDGLADTLSRLTRTERIVLMGAVPQFPQDVPACLSANLGDVATCQGTAHELLDPTIQRAITD